MLKHLSFPNPSLPDGFDLTTARNFVNGARCAAEVWDAEGFSTHVLNPLNGFHKVFTCTFKVT